MLLFFLPWLSLFNLFVEGVLAQHRVVLLQFDTIRSILPVLSRDVAGCSGHARTLVLGALQYHLYAVASLGHLSKIGVQI